MNVHPLAELFPLLSGEAFDDLVENIRINGQVEPIVVLGNVILDGRNRKRACDQLAKSIKQVQFESLGLKTTPEQYIWSKNGVRRHLTPDQRAQIEVKWKLATKREEGKRAKSEGGKKAAPGRPAKDVNERSQPSKRNPTSRAQMAQEAHVSERKVQEAITVQETDPEAADDVIAGKVSLSQAVKEAKAKSPAPAKKGKKKPPFDPEIAGTRIYNSISRQLKRTPEAHWKTILEKLIRFLDGWRINL